MEEKVLILTVRMDNASQQYFDELRKRYFPPERNFLKAHLTLFHQLKDLPETIDLLSELSLSPFQMQVTTLINLGAGVAFRIEGEQLSALRATLSRGLSDQLNAQDKHGFRGHVTVQNKTTPEIARGLLAELLADFNPFSIKALGLDLWYYLGGPWEHKQFFPFPMPDNSYLEKQ